MAAAALLIGALAIHDVVAGPLLFGSRAAGAGQSDSLFAFDIESGECTAKGNRPLRRFEHKIENGRVLAYW